MQWLQLRRDATAIRPSHDFLATLVRLMEFSKWHRSCYLNPPIQPTLSFSTSFLGFLLHQFALISCSYGCSKGSVKQNGCWCSRHSCRDVHEQCYIGFITSLCAYGPLFGYCSDGRVQTSSPLQRQI